jgi:hypothetical protein
LKKHARLPVVLVVVFVACGDSVTSTTTSSGGGDGGSGEAAEDAAAVEGAASDSGVEAAADVDEKNVCVGIADKPACAPAIGVATAADVFAQIAMLTEYADASTQKDSGVKLRPTPDLRATTTIHLDAAAFRSAHPVCPPGTDAGLSHGRGCVESVFTGEQNWTGSPFYIASPNAAKPLPSGVTCTASDDDGCSELTIVEGTVVRFARAYIPYVFGGYWGHFIRVQRACEEPCQAAELRCAASNTCIVDTSFCLLCEGGSLKACACRDRCTRKADGAACQYDTSDDTGRGGTCSAGTCTP